MIVLKQQGLIAQLARFARDSWAPEPDNLCALTKAVAVGLLYVAGLVFIGSILGAVLLAFPLAPLAVWLHTGYLELQGLWGLAWVLALGASLGAIGATGAAARSDFGQVMRGAISARAERFCPRVEYRA